MIFNSKAFLLAICLLFSLSEIKAQVCTGALGDPIAGAGTDFGRGVAQYGPTVPETNYSYKAGNPEDGQYTIVKTTSGLNSGWHQNVTNHTPNDPDGYFMVVNADYNAGIFYKATITNRLCPNTTYEFASFIINILRNSGIKPKIKFTISNNSAVIKEFSSGDIQEGLPTDWIKYGGTFTTPSNLGVIELVMTNENPGGSGNDLAIDDITFRACGPTITPSITNSVTGTIANICASESKSFLFSAAVSAGYDNPDFQWQINDGSGWTNLNTPNSQTTDLTYDFLNANVGIYNFRLLVAEHGNINAPNCRVVSSPLTINVNAKPNPIASNSGGCVGGNIQLFASEGVSFKWTGPNGYQSSEQNPIIPNVTENNAGIYQVIVTNAANCSNDIPSSTIVQVLPPVVANTNFIAKTICEHEPVVLIATGGISYKWLPMEGLSNPNISNPIATPKQTTTYTVTVSNGICSDIKTVTITVLKMATVTAGGDKKLLASQSVTLNGVVGGDRATYFWTPADYLDDPTKLNPIATPPTDIIYTLHVQSPCTNGITGNVYLKVYPKIEIPNTFTPNGDGINDTWNIPSISAFPNSRLKVVNRYGQIVFESFSYSPWNGKSNGKDLPIGPYYYTLYLNEDFKIYTGWVLLTR